MWRRWPGHGTLPDVVVPATDQLKRVEDMLTIRKEFYDNIYDVVVPAMDQQKQVGMLYDNMYAALRRRVKMLLQRIMAVQHSPLRLY